MNENKVNWKSIFKILGVAAMIVVVFISLIGSFFGLYNSEKNNGGIDTNYDDYIQFSADVVDIEDGLDINDAANSVYETLDFLGLQNATISIVGEDRLIVTNPIDTYDESDKDETPITEMTLENNNAYLLDAESLFIPLFFSGSLDFRTTTGDEIFTLDETGNYFFDEEAIESANAITDSGDGTTEGGDGTTTSYSSEYEARDAIEPGDFYTDASVKHESGNAVIEVGIKQSGTDSDEYVNMFKDFNNWINETTAASGDSTYVIYFGFDKIFTILSTLGLVSTEAEVYDFVSQNELLRPLYITTSTDPLMDNLYQDYITIDGGFNDEQAKYYTDKINNANNFQYSNIDIVLISNFQTKIFLYVMASLLIVLILVVIFTLLGYFGLLGLISSSIFLITSTIGILIFASTGIMISGLTLMAMFIAILIISVFIFSITDKYRNLNKDEKTLSKAKIFVSKFKSINRDLFLPTISLIIIMYISGLILSITLAVAFYLIAIIIALMYVVNILILIPLIYLFDYAFNFTANENKNKRWNFLTGFETKNYIENINVNVQNQKNKTLAFSLSGLILLLLAGIVSGIGFTFTGSAINSTLYGQETYVYNVRMVDEQGQSYITGSGENLENNIIEIEPIYNATVDAKDELENTLSNSMKVTDVEVVRFDDTEKIEDNNELYSSFGYQVYSSTKLTTEDISEFNNSQAAKDFTITFDDKNNNDASFVGVEIIDDEMSMVNGEAQETISYTEEKYAIYGIYAVLIILLIVSILALITSGWGVSLATLIVMLLEAIFIITPMFILFIPYNFLVWMPILIALAISASLKISISKKAKEDTTKENNWERSSRRTILLIPILSMSMLVLELLMIGVYGWLAILPMIFVTILIPIVNFVTQQIIYPFIARFLGEWRNKVKQNKHMDDVRKSENSDEPHEEFIEGVNM